MFGKTPHQEQDSEECKCLRLVPRVRPAFNMLIFKNAIVRQCDRLQVVVNLDLSYYIIDRSRQPAPFVFLVQAQHYYFGYVQNGKAQGVHFQRKGSTILIATFENGTKEGIYFKLDLDQQSVVVKQDSHFITRMNIEGLRQARLDILFDQLNMELLMPTLRLPDVDLVQFICSNFEAEVDWNQNQTQISIGNLRILLSRRQNYYVNGLGIFQADTLSYLRFQKADTSLFSTVSQGFGNFILKQGSITLNYSFIGNKLVQKQLCSGPPFENVIMAMKRKLLSEPSLINDYIQTRIPQIEQLQWSQRVKEGSQCKGRLSIFELLLERRMLISVQVERAATVKKKGRLQKPSQFQKIVVQIINQLRPSKANKTLKVKHPLQKEIAKPDWKS